MVSDRRAFLEELLQSECWRVLAAARDPVAWVDVHVCARVCRHVWGRR